MTASYRRLGEVIPVMGLADGCIISKRGDVTVGWEITLPVAYSMTEEGYDEIVSSFASAVRTCATRPIASTSLSVWNIFCRNVDATFIAGLTLIVVVIALIVIYCFCDIQK